MRRSPTGRSTARSTNRRRAPADVDVYLFPAVVGGGLGDIEEVLAAGDALARAGFRLRLLRLGDRALPRSVDGPWSWPRLARRTTLSRRGRAALTVAPSWGVSAAPGRPGALGRGGAWEAEAAAIEAAYGPRSTLHVSLEEFARTLTARSEDRERLREGGVPARALAERLRRSERAGEQAALRAAYRRFRGFDRPNVLHLYASFRPDPEFEREFPEAVVTGPLWPAGRVASPRRGSPPGRREWVWYASPASAETIAPEVVEGLRGVRPPIHLVVRTDRSWRWIPPAARATVLAGPRPARAWQRRFAAAELRIVTGSRTLLEAMALGGPFLYFNGVLGAGRRRRRHRPEKLRALLEVARTAGVAPGLRRDLAEFAQGRRVASIVRRAAGRVGPWARFPSTWPLTGFRPPFDDAGRLLVDVARALARAPDDAPGVVARFRAAPRAL